jgi:hypothetical protein
VANDTHAAAVEGVPFAVDKPLSSVARAQQVYLDSLLTHVLILGNDSIS